MQLTRELIVNAAIEILDAYGLSDMSMRRVATHLNVAPGALYWHVRNKQELIHAIAAKLLSPVTGESPAAAIRDYCAELRSCLLSHRDGAELIASALAQPGAELRARIEANLTRLVEGEGHDGDRAATASRALLHLLLGASVQQQMSAQFTAVAASSPAAGDPDDAPFPVDDVDHQIELVLQGL